MWGRKSKERGGAAVNTTVVALLRVVRGRYLIPFREIAVMLREWGCIRPYGGEWGEKDLVDIFHTVIAPEMEKERVARLKLGLDEPERCVDLKKGWEKMPRLCAVEGCGRKVGEGQRMLCVKHYRIGGCWSDLGDLD